MPRTGLTGQGLGTRGEETFRCALPCALNSVSSIENPNLPRRIGVFVVEEMRTRSLLRWEQATYLKGGERTEQKQQHAMSLTGRLWM